jgi:hypothetical protein
MAADKTEISTKEITKCSSCNAKADAPRTDPSEPDSGTGLLPRVWDGEAHIRPGLKDARLREPVPRYLRDAIPSATVLLTAPPKRAPPDVAHIMPECRQRPDVRRDGSVSLGAIGCIGHALPVVGFGMQCCARHVDRRLVASGLSGLRKAIVGSGARTATNSSTSAAPVCSTVRRRRPEYIYGKFLSS